MAEKDTGSFGKSKVVNDMLRDFKLSADAEADNRTRALFILDFIRPGADQWDAAQVKARGSRATYSFNQLPKFGRQVINDMWQNMPQIKFIPKGDTNNEKAEILEDKIREIQANGSAQTAYKMAIASQINIGWGYFAFGTAYENDEGFDQNILIRQIPNTFQIYDDPTTKEQDRSDRRYLIEVEDMPRTEFNDAHDMDYTSNDLSSIGDTSPSWASMGKDLVRVGHYWRIEHDKKTLYRNKKTGKLWEPSEGKKKPDDMNNYDSREVRKPKVMYYKCTALDKLEERKWEGKHIPFCFVEGNKNIVDGKTYYTGLYEDMISTQVLFNYATNTAIELAESAPIAPFMGDYRAFKGFEKYYDEANAKNYAYLPYNAVDENGQQIAAPQRTQNGADLGSAVALIQMAEQNFYGTSGIYPASLGQQSNEKSGKAIIARQKEGDVSTSNYPDAFARALLYGGEIFEDLRKKIYDGSRDIEVMSEDKKTRTVKINQKYKDEKTGKPMNYDLTKGEHSVQVATGPSFSTKREEARESQIALFQAAPQAMLPALPMIIRNMDWPQADKTADAVERGLPPELRDPERMDEQMKDIPPAVAGQLMQAQQIIEQLGAQLQEAQAVANDKQTENQAKLADVQIKAQAAQTTAQKDAAEAEYKRMELQFEAEKFASEQALEQERIRLEWAKLELEQLGMQQGEQGEAPEQGEPARAAPRTRNEAQAMLMDMDDAAAQGAAELALKDKEISTTAQSAQMIMQTLMSVKESLDQQTQVTAALVQSVNSPKQVIRDPKTGLVRGVTTVQ